MAIQRPDFAFYEKLDGVPADMLAVARNHWPARRIAFLAAAKQSASGRTLVSLARTAYQGLLDVQENALTGGYTLLAGLYPLPPAQVSSIDNHQAGGEGDVQSLDPEQGPPARLESSPAA